MLFDSTLATNSKVWTELLQNPLTATKCQRQHLHDRLDYEQHLFVHVKVSKLVKFDRLIPNYVATG